ncbi:MAG TPA: YbhB/YbcL family Raf kinase inhibitor-like protein [Nitriliruptorales bacterium]
MGLNIADLRITSSSFENHGKLDRKHSHEADDVSPELSWSGVPDGTRSLAVICHDPDAPLPFGFTHWVTYGIPAHVTSIDEGDHAPYTQGTTDFGNQRYNGPLPPEGHGTHHYYFWVYALDTEVGDGAGLSRAEFLGRYGDNIIEQNRTVGTYARG